MASVTVFDGAGCIGGNKIYLEFDGHGLFFDFGMNYGKMGRFYEEFLKPRPNRGLHDLLATEVIPPLSCYRTDLVPGDVSLARAHKLTVDAVLISHAHMDHIGHASLLDTSIPFACTALSAAIVKALRDCNRSDVQYDCPYTSPKECDAADDRVLRSSSSAPNVGRNFVLAGQCSKEFADFWSSTPSSKAKGSRKEYQPGALNSLASLDLDIISFDVDHSIYGASAYAVNTDAGWVIYTGDLRTHGMNGNKTAEFVSKARSLEPRLLIVEGTRASRQDKRESEDMVKENCLKAVRDESGLLVADFGPRNIERLDIFDTIAHETGRELVVLLKDAYLLDAMRCAEGTDRLKGLRIYNDLRTKEDKFEDEVRNRYHDNLVDARDIRAEPGRYIACFSFWDMGRLLDIKPEGGTYVYSSSEAYSEEQQIDFRRLTNWLRMFRMNIVGYRMVGEPNKEIPEQVPGYHASGHISAPALLDLVREIHPKTVMPVHTENPAFFDVLRDDGIEVVAPTEGKAYRL